MNTYFGIRLSPKSQLTALLVAAVLLLSAFVVYQQVAGAANTSAIADSSGGYSRFKQGGASRDLIKITIGSNENTENLLGVTVTFTSSTGAPSWDNAAGTSSELADLTTASTSGVSLWKETGGGTGFQAASDTNITLAASPTYSGSAFTLTPAATTTLATDDVFYVVLKPDSAGVTNNNAFTVTLAANGISTSASSPTITAVTTTAITSDTVAPTTDSSRHGPPNGTTGVPISSFIFVAFSEGMDPTTLNSTNLTMTAGGTPVGIGVAPLFDGANIMVSSPPTYAASSRFSKLSTLGTAFYYMQGTSPIFPNGTYTAPAVGDIVYFQHDSFPMEVGLITTSTLTSGTFAVNGFPLYGGQRITKVATPTATGLVTATTTLTLGDLIIVNTTSNPTDVRYNWHLVTTAAEINSSTLRLDGAGSAPAFASGSRFSTITPAATATDNGATGGGVLAVSVGDLVFAKLNGASTYAWHLATGAGNLSSDDGEITALLNGAAATSTSKVAASSVMSKLTPAAQGAVTESVTPFSIGDIVFAHATANAANLNSYNFHLVSAPATGANNTGLRFDNSLGNLSPSTNYVITVGVGVTDKAGNPMAAQQTISFTTGATGGTNVTPPFVQSTTPTGGNQTFPVNAPILINFSVPMANTGSGSATSTSNVGLFTENFGGPGTPVTAALSLDATLQTLTITPSANLATSTNYVVSVANTTKSSNGASMANPYMLNFRTASAADTAKPRVMGAYPSASATNVTRSLNAICAGLSEAVSPSTVTSSTVTLSGSITGVVSYDSMSQSACFSPTMILAASTTYTFTLTTSITDLAGNAFDNDTATGGNQNFTSTFTTDSGTDSTDPAVQMVNADNFGLAVTFSEPMKSGGGPNAVDNIANYTVESPVGSAVALVGKTVVYDGRTMTARISGLSLVNGNSVKVTVSNVAQDLSGRTMSTTGTPAQNTGQATVLNSSMTGGNLGPGTGGNTQTGSQFGMTPIRVSPMVRAAGATSQYMIEFPLTQAIASGGTITITFPAGFGVGSTTATTAGTNSFANSDINGPAAGTITIASVSANASAQTITVTTAGGATGANDFLRFDLSGIVNSTVPSNSGYTATIITRSAAGVIQENLTSGPFFLGSAGSNTLTVTVFNDNGAGGGTASNNVKDGSEAAIENANVFLFSPATGGQKATTNGSGVASFTSLANGDYEVGLQPDSVASGNFITNTAPQRLTLSASSTKAFGLAEAPYVISGTVSGIANTSVDVFATSQNGFTVRTYNTGAGASVAYSLPVAANTTYNVGVGPAIPKDNMIPGSTMTMPTFTFMPPPSREIRVAAASVTGQNFALSATNKTITGTVADSSGNGVAGAQLFARPMESSTNSTTSVGFGTGGQTNTSGAFTLNVVPGTYIVEAFKPGMPPSPGKQITVPTTGTNTPASLSFTLAINSSGLTISGTVKDQSGNAIPYAGVSARRVNSTSDTTAIGGDAGNFLGGPTDANGAYTLYVSANTVWVVEAFAPSLGRLGSKTISVGSASVTGQDFSAETLSLGTVTGQALRAGAARQGVNVRVEGSSGANMGITDASGNFSVKVPAGTYSVYCYFPGFGDAPPVTSVAVTANNTTSGQDCNLGTPITVTVQLTDGAAGITNAWVDARDSNGRGYGTNVSTASSTYAVYSLSLTPGTYTIRAGHPSYGQIGSTASVSTTQTITYTATAGAMKAVTGTVQASGAAVEGAWVSLTGTPTGQTNLIHIGGLTDSTGAFSIQVPPGSYQLRADKPGYKSPAAATVTVANDPVAAGIVTLTVASKTIGGTVTLSGNPVSNAFVDASDGNGGFAVAQTNTSGVFSLAVDTGTWSVRAHSDGYVSPPTQVTVGSSNVSGVALALAAITGYVPKEATAESITPTSGGQIFNTDIGSNFKLVLPPNTLGTGSNAATVSTKPTTNMPNPATGAILSNNAVTISAVDSSGAPITQLAGDNITITIPYTEADLPAGASESSLVVGTWSDATQTYTTLSTTVDTTANTLTATVSHLSDFAPLVATNPNAPATPTNVTATAESSSVVVVGWSTVAGAASYDVYRSTTSGGTFARLGSEPTVSGGGSSSYTVTGLTAGTTYYFKVTSLNSSGNESAASAEVSVTTGTGGGGLPGGGNSPSPSPAGGSGGAAAPAVTPTPTPAATPTSTAPTPTPTPTPTAPATTPAAAATFSQNLTLGMGGEKVVALQSFLEARGFLTMPANTAKGFFGGLTKKALQAFQASVGIEATGNLGPLTRAKVNSELSVAVPATAATPTPTTPATTPAATGTFSRDLETGMEGEDVKALQVFLNSHGFVLAETGPGSPGNETTLFGRLTRLMLIEYQKTNNISPAAGYFGPKTRAKVLSE